MVYGFLFAYLTAILNRKTAALHLTIKAFIAGSVFTAFWAIFQLFCNLTGIKYPAMIFNTGTS